MRWGLRRWLRRLLDSLLSRSEQSEAAADEEEPEAVSSQLYTCTACETTYITTGMQTCPDCGAAVEATPSFAELGIDIDDDT